MKNLEFLADYFRMDIPTYLLPGLRQVMQDRLDVIEFKRQLTLKESEQAEDADLPDRAGH